MSGRQLLRCVPVLALVLAAAMPMWGAAPATTNAPKIDPQAVQLLRQMADYMRGLQTFSVHVDAAKDVVLDNGQTLTSDLAYDLMVRRPDGLAVKMTSAAGGAEVYYDGKTVTVYTPKKNYYAVMPAPATIQETVAAAVQKGISLPLADFLSKETGKNLLANITSATFVGTSMVNGIMANQLAFRQKGVDWQIWIEDSSTPVPLRLAIIDTKQKDTPRFVATLSQWNINPTFEAGTFTFVPPEGAQKINFRELPKLQRGMTKPSPAK